MTDSYHSYPKVYALGHRQIEDLLLDPVIVEEKLDGSQFSFGVFDGEIKCRSKGQQLIVDAPEKLFDAAVATVKGIAPLLHDGWTYRAEYLRTPRHNTLRYERIPEKHLAIFDINTGHEHYLMPDAKTTEAHRIGIEVVPFLLEGTLTSPDQLRDFLDRDSMLGGTKIEGVVVKNYRRFAPDGKALMGKYVREDFKEMNAVAWKLANPKQGDIVQRNIELYRTDARWRKAVQHLAESGSLDNSPRDIGNLIAEVKRDTLDECGDDIKAALFAWAWPQIQRGICAGLPEWYKGQLLEKQFNQPENTNAND